MTGITSFGAYIPYYRLAHKTLAAAWGGRALDGERAVAEAIDYLPASQDPPTVMVIVVFTGGGRAYLMMTDQNPADVHIEQEVEMAFRKMYEAEGFTQYYWKCRPVR